MDRAILHIRIPSFFAEVERARRPELAAEIGAVPSAAGGLSPFPRKPIIIARPKGNTSGVVVSASAEAMKSGVVDGMSVRHAKRSCPDAVVISADNDLYRQLYEQFLDMLAHCSPLLEPDPPDGAYLDVTGCRRLFGDPIKISRRIISRVQEKLGLRISVGCASNKLVAGIASRSQSIGGRIVNLCIGFEGKIISKLPVTALDSVNGKTAKQLRELGVTTVEQLVMIPEKLLVRRFGPVGSVMRKQSLGIDVSPVRAAYPPDITIIEHTFASPAEEPVQVEEYLAQMTGESLAKLRKKGALAGEVALKLFDESSHTQRMLREAFYPEVCAAAGPCVGVKSPPTHSPVVASYSKFKKPTDSAATMQQLLAKMLHDKMQPGMEVYRVQIVLSDLTPGESSQLCLIGDGERRNRIGRAVDLIRERFGEGSVFFASSLAAKDRAGVLPRIAA